MKFTSANLPMSEAKGCTSSSRAPETGTLRMFPCPPNRRKLVHRWRDRARLPHVREV
jgi:hypothetical protein